MKCIRVQLLVDEGL